MPIHLFSYGIVQSHLFFYEKQDLIFDIIWLLWEVYLDLRLFRYLYYKTKIIWTQKKKQKLHCIVLLFGKSHR